jgi:DNA invertase Pin-like site-specific DNA recombinase
MSNIGDRTSTQKLIGDLYSIKWNKEVDIREVIRTLYVDEKKNIHQIAKELHVGAGTFHKWLREYQIPVRKMQWL